jgi:hypothetical protein
MAVASSLDLVSLDNLSRTCWQVHQALLQYRGSLKAHTLHCVNEDVAMDPEDTLRYRARAGNWYYMEDMSHTGGNYNGKSGECARDMVAECRRCARVVCRVCATVQTSLRAALCSLPSGRHGEYKLTPGPCWCNRTVPSNHLLRSSSVIDTGVSACAVRKHQSLPWLSRLCSRILRSTQI